MPWAVCGPNSAALPCRCHIESQTLVLKSVAWRAGEAACSMCALEGVILSAGVAFSLGGMVL